jgi:hypothetical protein
VSFWLGKIAYSARSGAQITGESTSILFLLVKTVLWQVTGAVVFVVGLDFCDERLRKPSAFFGWLARHLPRIEATLTWFRHITPDPAISGGTLSTLAQIAGLFLGLYFTAISVVAGTSYARVPAEILDALVREKVGNLYIQVVAFFGGVSLMLLCASNLGLSARKSESCRGLLARHRFRIHFCSARETSNLFL